MKINVECDGEEKMLEEKRKPVNLAVDGLNPIQEELEETEKL